jgi:phosphohistidine phosphatase SixA
VREGALERRRTPRALLFVIGVLAVLPAARGVLAQTPPAPPSTPQRILAPAELVSGLRRGGYVIHLRHAATEPDRGGGQVEDVADCSTQRQLSELGRAQARQIGETFRVLGIPFGEVRASPYCRCLETARLAFGKVEVDPDLVSSVPASEPEAKRLAAALRAMLASPPAPGTNSALVGHMANLKEATGIWPEPEGVAHVFEPLASGAIRLVAVVPPDGWPALARER